MTKTNYALILSMSASKINPLSLLDNDTVHITHCIGKRRVYMERAYSFRLFTILYPEIDTQRNIVYTIHPNSYNKFISKHINY